jgi:hypothetical protein
VGLFQAATSYSSFKGQPGPQDFEMLFSWHFPQSLETAFSLLSLSDLGVNSMTMTFKMTRKYVSDCLLYVFFFSGPQ